MSSAFNFHLFGFNLLIQLIIPTMLLDNNYFPLFLFPRPLSSLNILRPNLAFPDTNYHSHATFVPGPKTQVLILVFWYNLIHDFDSPRADLELDFVSSER